MDVTLPGAVAAGTPEHHVGADRVADLRALIRLELERR
jgi:hypothetical protein